MKTHRHRAIPALIILLLATLPAAATALAGTRGEQPVATAPRFAFHSDFATNLNDALIAGGVARNFTRPGRFDSGPDKACFDELPASVRAGWSTAVAYYAEIVSPTDWNDRAQYLLRMDLAGLDEQIDEDGDRRFTRMLERVRAVAAPAYEACVWPGRDAENREWIDQITTKLAEHGDEIAARLQQHYRSPWPDTPIRIDVVETVNWSGANSSFPDGTGGHLLVSTSYEGDEALEIVFHEASHGFMLRGKPVPVAMAEAAEELGVPPPDDLWHVTLFHVTGETVRRVLGEAGAEGYRPMLLQIYERSDWVRYRDAIESVLPAYLDGETELPEAMLDLVRTASADADEEAG